MMDDSSDSRSNDFSSSGVFPPTIEEYRRMWEEQAKTMKENEYRRLSDKNRNLARKEIFQEAVKKAVSVKDPNLEKSFFDSINLMDK